MNNLLRQERTTGARYSNTDEEMAAEPIDLEQQYYTEQLPQIGVDSTVPRAAPRSGVLPNSQKRYIDSCYQHHQPTKTQQPLSKSQQFYLNQQQQLNQMFQNNHTPVYIPPFLIGPDSRPLRSRSHQAPLDYLLWSIANIFLCAIIAMPALFFSIQTRDLKRAGDMKKARLNSKRSLILNILASVLGILIIMLSLILRFALYQLFVYQDVQSQNVPIIAGG